MTFPHAAATGDGLCDLFPVATVPPLPPVDEEPKVTAKREAMEETGLNFFVDENNVKRPCEKCNGCNKFREEQALQYERNKHYSMSTSCQPEAVLVPMSFNQNDQTMVDCCEEPMVEINYNSFGQYSETSGANLQQQ